MFLQNANSTFGDDDVHLLPYPHPIPNLPGYASISQVVLVRASGGGDLEPPPSYAPSCLDSSWSVVTCVHCLPGLTLLALDTA